MAVKMVDGAVRWIRASEWTSMDVHADIMVCVCMCAHALVKWQVRESHSKGDGDNNGDGW